MFEKEQRGGSVGGRGQRGNGGPFMQGLVGHGDDLALTRRYNDWKVVNQKGI